MRTISSPCSVTDTTYSLTPLGNTYPNKYKVPHFLLQRSFTLDLLWYISTRKGGKGTEQKGKQGKGRERKTREGKARQGKGKQDKARQSSDLFGLEKLCQSGA